jgi:hypothetical protein
VPYPLVVVRDSGVPCAVLREWRCVRCRLRSLDLRVLIHQRVRCSPPALQPMSCSLLPWACPFWACFRVDGIVRFRRRVCRGSPESTRAGRCGLREAAGSTRAEARFCRSNRLGWSSCLQSATFSRSPCGVPQVSTDPTGIPPEGLSSPKVRRSFPKVRRSATSGGCSIVSIAGDPCQSLLDGCPAVERGLGRSSDGVFGPVGRRTSSVSAFCLKLSRSWAGVE